MACLSCIFQLQIHFQLKRCDFYALDGVLEKFFDGCEFHSDAFSNEVVKGEEDNTCRLSFMLCFVCLLIKVQKILIVF